MNIYTVYSLTPVAVLRGVTRFTIPSTQGGYFVHRRSFPKNYLKEFSFYYFSYFRLNYFFGFDSKSLPALGWVSIPPEASP